MTVADIANLACQDCGEGSPTVIAFAKSQLRLRYEILYNAHNWREAIGDPPMEFDLANPVLIPPLPGSSTSLSYTQTQALPLSYDRAVWCKGSTDGGASFTYKLKMRDRSWIEANDNASLLILTTGNLTQQPRYFYPGRPRGFPTLSPGTLTFTPTVSAATTFQVTIEGTDVNGYEQNETFSVSGTTPFTTANSYSEVHNISKSLSGSALLSTVPLTITPTSGTPVTWSPQDESLRYSVMVFWPAFNGAFRVRVGAKLKIDAIANDLSIPRISALYQALYFYVRAAVKGKQKQGDAEISDSNIAERLFKQARDLELSTAASFQQIQPKVYDDPSQIWDWWGWTG